MLGALTDEAGEAAATLLLASLLTPAPFVGVGDNSCGREVLIARVLVPACGVMVKGDDDEDADELMDFIRWRYLTATPFASRASSDVTSGKSRGKPLSLMASI